LENRAIDAVSPGAIVVFGSGETVDVGRAALTWLAARRTLRRVAVLETPAGFEPNSEDVTARWTESIRRHPALASGDVVQLPLRRRGTPLSPDEPSLAEALLRADVIALGAGSPTYAVRQLRDSVAWRYVETAHLLGADLLLASAGAIAVGSHALPVYEIYKVGDDPHWKRGLDLFALYGLPLALVPHWDNADGGAALDTSCCFMGASRFDELLAQLPAEVLVIGIDEHTALALDPRAGTADVLGRGGVTLRSHREVVTYASGRSIPFTAIGGMAAPRAGTLVRPDIADAIRAARSAVGTAVPPADVRVLVDLRERARRVGDWAGADALRQRIADRGWRVEDTPAGTRVLEQGVDP
jgi:hypothetical protein